MSDAARITELHDFNVSPLTQMEIPEFARLEPTLKSSLMSDPRSRGYLNAAFVARLNWGEPVELKAEDAFGRLMALPAAGLRKLARFCGCALAADLLKGTIVGQEIRAFRAALGEEPIDFVLFELQLLKVPALPELQVPDLSHEPAAVVDLAGGRAILGGCHGYPPAVARRVGLKLALQPFEFANAEAARSLVTKIGRALNRRKALA